jgi:hypothetical protein
MNNERGKKVRCGNEKYSTLLKFESGEYPFVFIKQHTGVMSRYTEFGLSNSAKSEQQLPRGGGAPVLENI